MKVQHNSEVNTRFFVTIRKILAPLAGPNNLKVELVLAVLEARLNKLNNELSEGMDTDEAFRLTMRTMDKAIATLTKILGVSARLAVCEAILATGITNKVNHEAIAA